MQSVDSQYRLLKKVRDEQFEEDQIGHYNLVLLTSPKDLQVLVCDARSEHVLLLEDFAFPNVRTDEEWLVTLQSVFDQHPFLSAGFWNRILIGFKIPKFVHVPISLFEAEAAHLYLRHNAAINEEDEVLHFLPAHREIATVFAVPRSIKDWLSSVYSLTRPVFTHQSCALIEGVLAEASHHTDYPLYIYVDRFKLHIMAANNQGLRYYNQFVIQNFSDYIRYIMLVMHALHMNPRTSRIIMWGFIGKNSPHYQEFYKYIQTIEYGKRPRNISLGYMFDELQEHQYFDVLNLTRMV